MGNYGRARVSGPAGRTEVHGDKGSFVKHGLDPQVESLLSGRRPGDPGWGSEREDRYGTLTTEARNTIWIIECALQSSQEGRVATLR